MGLETLKLGAPKLELSAVPQEFPGVPATVAGAQAMADPGSEEKV